MAERAKRFFMKNFFNKNGSNLGFRLLSLALSAFLLINVLSVIPIVFKADEAIYPVPAKIAPIDDSRSDGEIVNAGTANEYVVDNAAWYSSTDARYSGYASGFTLGAADTPYIIKTGSELAALASYVNEGTDDFYGDSVKLVGSKNAGRTTGDNCIDLIGEGGLCYQTTSGIGWVNCNSHNDNSESWTPIGNETHAFQGTIYAETGVKIYNLSARLTTNTYTAFGLFGYVGRNAYIHDINLVDTQIYAGSGVNTVLGTVAGIVDLSKSGGVTLGSAVIKDCSNIGLDTEWRDGSGVLQHRTETANGTAITVTDGDPDDEGYVVPDFTVRSDATDSCVGGIIGKITGGNDGEAYTFSGFTTDMLIRVSSGKGIGGIVGRMESCLSDITLQTVSGKANIQTVAPTSGSMYRVGGIMGYAENCSTVKTVKNEQGEAVQIKIGSTLTIKDVHNRGLNQNNVSIDTPYTVNLYGNAYCDNGDNGELAGFAGILGFAKDILQIDIGSSGDPCLVSVSAKLNKSKSDNNNFYFGGIIGRIKSGVGTLNVSYCTVIDTEFTRLETPSSADSGSYRVSVGGIIGGVGGERKDGKTTVPVKGLGLGYVRHCTVKDTDLYCDGLAGGIIGLGLSDSGCNIDEITDCEADNLSITQATFNGIETNSNGGNSLYPIIGGIVASVKDTTTKIEGCTVNEFTVGFLMFQNELTYNTIGGIAGRVDAASGFEIKNCKAASTFNIGSVNSGNGTMVAVGGIAGYAANATLTGCEAIIDYNTVTSVTIPTGTFSFSSGVTVIHGAVCGGIVGYAGVSVTIEKSLSSGDINLEKPSSIANVGRPGSIGGLVGIAKGNSFSMTNSFSTASISGNFQDSIGGLVGGIAGNSASVSNCHFGGTLTNNNAASIVQYSKSTSFSGITYNGVNCPNAASADGSVSVTNSAAVPSGIITNGGFDTVNDDYYKAAIASYISFTGSHIFVVNNLITADATHTVESSGTNYQIIDCVTSSGAVTVNRRVKLIKNLISTSQNGVGIPFTIDTTAKFASFKSYVAIGGGFLGSQFNVTADISVAVDAPVGTVNPEMKYADKENLPFCGNFGGGNKTITVTGNTAAAVPFNGLFGFIQNATVSNLKINYSNASTVASASGYAGGLVGCARFSKLDNVTVTANNGITLSGSASGGIVGLAISTPVNSSSSSAKTYFNGKLCGGSNVGGIIGRLSNDKPSYNISGGGGGRLPDLTNAITVTYSAVNSSLVRCYTAGDIIGGAAQTGAVTSNVSTNVGGLIGSSIGANGQIQDSFMFGNVTGGKYVGGMVGFISGLSILQTQVLNAYVNGDVYADDFAGGIAGYIINNGSGGGVIRNGYFVGQIECDNNLGALTSATGNYLNFFYDKQVAGNLPITADVTDDSASALSGENLIQGVNTESGDQSEVEYNISAYASQITTNPTGTIPYNPDSSDLSADDLILTFSGAWAYTAGLISSISDHENNNRFNCEITTGNEAVMLTFTGTHFKLWDYISSGHDAYKIEIDGTEIEFDPDSSVAYNSSLNTYTQSFTDRNNSEATISYLSKPDHGIYDYLMYISSDAGLQANHVINSLEISGLSQAEHTIKIIGVKTRTKTKSYLNIRGFEYGGTVRHNSISLGEAMYFDENMTNYPQLTAFRYDAISELSTKYIYDFTNTATNTAHTFRTPHTITVNKATADSYDTTPESLDDLGITVANDVYTKSEGTHQGSFVYNYTHDNINGYDLLIKEKIIVIPFAVGDGTSESPYGLRNVAELVMFRDFVNNVYGGAGLYFKLTMGDTAYTTGLNVVGGKYVYDLSDDEQNETPSGTDTDFWNISVGSEAQPFQGEFDGNGKVISNLKIGPPSAGSLEDVQVGTTTRYAGFFGHTAGAVIKNVTLNGTVTAVGRGNNTSIGSLVAVADNTTIINAYADCDINVTYSSGSNYGLGGIVGKLQGASVIEGAVSLGDIVFAGKTGSDGDNYSVGGISGSWRPDVSNQSALIRNSVAYGTYSSTRGGVYSGGIVGTISNNSVSANIEIENNASYGTITAVAGNIGGFIGRLNTANISLNLTGNTSTMSLISGNTAVSCTGGFVGSINANAGDVFTGNVFGGEINTVYFADSTTGGIFGKKIGDSDITNGGGNAFDITKNRDLDNYGNASSTDTYGKKTYELLDSTGNYQKPDLSDAALTYGLASNKTTVETVVNANSVSVNIVRVDNVNGSTETKGAMELTSAFISSVNTATLSKLAISTATEYKITNGNKRFVSTANSANMLTLQAVNMVSGVDTFGGYGKRITYYPSIKDVGLTDASYICANPNGNGDAITRTGCTYTFYNCDQLMGLDNLVKESTYDGFGNKIYSAVTSDYSVHLAKDISAEGVDYTGTEDTATTFSIGDAANPFTGTFDGEHHIIYGFNTRTSETNTGLFEKLSGAKISNLGITDSAFVLTVNGNAGCFAGIAENSDIENSFSSARVEHGLTVPTGVNIGGFVGTTSGSTFKNSFFTGSVGVSPTDNSQFITVDTEGVSFSGGFVGTVTEGTESTENTSFDNCYVATYVHGAVNHNENTGTYTSNTGMFAAKGGDYVEFAETAGEVNSKADNSVRSENCSALGDKPSQSVGTISNAEIEYYDSVWDSAYRTTREKTARIVAHFSNSASSMSTVSIVNGTLTSNNYYSVPTVWGSTDSELYLPSGDDGKTCIRNNNGTASVIVSFTEDGVTSYRIIVMSLQCWYDNFRTENGVKVYSIKSASDLLELAQMIEEGTDINVGHSHLEHTGTGIATDRFNGAVITLAANIAANGEVMSLIGKTAATAFAGTFDGNGYVISNANFESENGIGGLFGYISADATVKNLILSGETVVTVDESETDDVYIGLAVAQYTAGTVENCYMGADVRIINNSSQKVYFGAVTGNVASGKTLQYCYNMGHIIGASDTIYLIGGIAAKNAGTINHCYNTGIIEGYTDLIATDYVKKSTVAGICAENTGTVDECYNSAVLRNYAQNKLFPIADGTVTDCYINGQTLNSQYPYRVVAGGYAYSAGITVLSADEMSSGTEIDDSWQGWTYNTGYYPQFSVFYTGGSPIGGARKVSSTVSSLATTLDGWDDKTPTFESYSSITFTYGSNVFVIEPYAGTLAQYNEYYGTSGGNAYLKLTVKKKGASVIYIRRTSGESTLTRETYFINQETFTIRYMFDFGELVNNPNESTSAVCEYEASVNTFDTANRSDYGQGTAGSPYIINTVDDLTAFADYVNNSSTGGRDRYFKLVRNLDCSGLTSWTPIGNKSKPFQGAFIGSGFTISGIPSSTEAYNGLFGYAGESSSIQLVGVIGSTFNVNTTADSHTGAIAGYSDGLIANCYSRAVIYIGNSEGNEIYAGGLVGELGPNSVMRGCYVRPAQQSASGAIPDNSNTIVSYNTVQNGFYCGILAGKISGVMSGCYHTAEYFEPTGVVGLAKYGAVFGWKNTDSVSNTFYDRDVLPVADKDLYLKYMDTDTGVKTGIMNVYGKTTAEFKALESAGSTNGVANDSMALQLSQDLYIGTYEMTPLLTAATNNNDGYPMLTAFDLAQYKFNSFDSSDIILCMQNVDADNVKMMNALCSYEYYDFPIYADIIARGRINTSVFSLPENISYNVSAVGYGVDDTGALKWTVINGSYTNSRALNTVAGIGMIENTVHKGNTTLSMDQANCLPESCYKMYVYITLSYNSDETLQWGVYHDWNSSSLQELPEDVLLDE